METLHNSAITVHVMKACGGRSAVLGKDKNLRIQQGHTRGRRTGPDHNSLYIVADKDWESEKA